MFVTEQGRFITQRECGALARIDVSIDAESLVLRAAGHPELSCPLGVRGAKTQVRIWSDECNATPVDVDTRDWMRSVAGIRAQLVRLTPGEERVSSSRFTGEQQSRYYLADAFALLLAGESSLTDLNARLPKPLPMARFRPNVVLRGIPPYAEDEIDRLIIGKVELRCVKPCIRCITTTTDQQTGERDGDEPLLTLKKYRRLASLGGVAFGMNAIIVRGAGERLAVGDRGEVIWRQPGAARPW
jgi:uncharacterized protein YcbX